MSIEVLILGAGASLFLMLLLVLLVMMDRQRSALKSRIERAARGFDRSAAKDDDKVKAPEPERTITSSRLARALERLELACARAGIRASATELLVQISMSVLGLYAVFVLVLKMPALVSLVLSLFIPIASAVLIFRIKRKRHVASFTEGLPEALDVFARGLKAGRPVADSLSIVVENAKGPVKTEFERCRDELNVGASLLGSLERLCTRMPTQEVVFFSVATSLQSETGGNLIETIENLAEQLRERRKLKKKARALSSEARASAVILAALPFAVSATIGFLNPGYLQPLFTDSRGQIMLSIGIISIALGVFIMARMG
ncbi:MAG: type II secretion system F family protein, partial [Planktotalea sp.]|uniref:type II secretion system F family protein n=1 Tax=Planktotalea sp. TaxID=2029877 RepID=UPI003C719994